MIHEVLMALAGYQGSLFSRSRGSEFRTFLHPGEVAVLDQIEKISTCYKTLKDFVEEHILQIGQEIDVGSAADESDSGIDSKENSPKLRRGLYLHAFCNKLSEVLEPYQRDLAILEREALNDSHFPLTHVLFVANKYSTLFYFLNRLITQVKQQDIHGFQFLGLLNRHLSSGAPEVTCAIRRMLLGCHIVMLKQLSSWLLYGQLTDTCNEFFIQKVENSRSCSSPHTVKTEFDKDSDTGIDTKFEIQSSEKSGTIGNKTFYPGLSEYVIDYDALPPYIAASLAHKIVFVGEILLVLGSNDNPNEHSALSMRNEISMWGGKEKEYFMKLQQLQYAESIVSFEFQLEKAIDEIYCCVSEHLWQLAVDKGKLFLQLKLMKDFFFLGRGELFLEFIKQAAPVLAKPPCSTTNRDLNQALQVAAREVHLSDESALEKFSFSIPVKDRSKDEESMNPWQLISLKYKVSWPLHLLFGPEVLDNYNHLFGFLLRVTKVQFELNTMWSNKIKDKFTVKKTHGSAVWQLRNNLVFLINNLQYYLQVDVLESQYMQLKTSLVTTKDFQTLQHAHTIFLTNVLSQTFILMGQNNIDHHELTTIPSDKTSGFKANPVHRSLISFISLCEIFCEKVISWKFPMTAEEEIELQQMTAEFMTQMKFLLELLSSFRSQPCGTHLSKLLLRLDYNRWFSQLFRR